MSPFTLFYNALIVFNVFMPAALAHIGAWDESMFGRCGSNNQCTNTAEPVHPLQGLTFDQWWWHGYLEFPPPDDSVMALPAGQNVTIQLAGNVAFTKLGQYPNAFWPGGGQEHQKDQSVEGNGNYWGYGASGNLHTTGHSDVAGCALSIAYTSRAKDVRPEDMIIFSVQYDCVWKRDTVFEIPADMPPCTDGKCQCSWWWIHNSDGGTDQMFQTPFQCNVTHAPGQRVSQRPLGKPVPPVNCEKNSAACIKGPKMPMYWKQKECNNMNEPGHHAPTYNQRYGFADGAQMDLIQTVHKSNWTCPQSKAVGVFKRETPVPLRHRMIKRRHAGVGPT